MQLLLKEQLLFIAKLPVVRETMEKHADKMRGVSRRNQETLLLSRVNWNIAASDRDINPVCMN